MTADLKSAWRLIAAWAMICWGVAQAGEPIAYVLFGGNAPQSVPGGNAVGNYVDWAVGVAQRFKRHNIKRAHWQNPGGCWVLVPVEGNINMRVDQWTIAERVRASYANRRDLRTAVGILERHGITENIFYLGNPTQLLDPVKELPECVQPFLDCGPTVSIAFDALFDPSQDWRTQWASDSPYRKALIELRKKCKVYAEPRLTAEQVKFGLGKLVDGTIAEVSYDEQFKPDLSIQPGETIRTTRTGNHKGEWAEEIKAWPKGLTAEYRSELNWGPLMDK